VKRLRRVSVLHGLLGHPEALGPFCSSVTAALDVPTRAVLLPGHSESPWGMEHRSFEEVVLALASNAFLNGADDELIVGYSLGGRLALGLLAHVEPAAVVVIGAHLGIADPQERLSRRRWDLEKAAQVRDLGVEKFAGEWEQEPLFASQRALPEATLAVQRRARSRHLAEGIAWCFDVLGTGQMPELLPRVRAHRSRVQIVVGAKDAKFIAHYEAFPELSPIVVPQAGHNVLLERPEALVEVVRNVARLIQGNSS
jgi:2-succinyl-6-hydroxy-2,4-cyclohexadiene-1-carboxylate synthase